MAEYNAFLKIVKERHDPSIGCSPVCPYCSSESIDVFSTISTLMGFGNRVWKECKCKDCEKTFVYEIKEGSKYKKQIIWYTKDRRILKGIPGCFEKYLKNIKYKNKVVTTSGSNFEFIQKKLNRAEIKYVKEHIK